MLIGYKRGQGSIVLRVKILNSSVATGAGLTGLTSSSTGLIISTMADNESTATAYTVAASNVETITTLGTYAAPTSGKCRFKEVDATNHKGVYEIQIADARYNVASAKSLLVSISGATNAAETDVVIPLRDLDPFDAVRAGLTALPNAAAEASGGLITRGTGTGQLTVSSGAVTVGTNNDKTGYSLTQTFPSNFSSLAITAGGSVTAGTVSDKTGYSLASSQTFSTTGSVGSVTGAVGSVTGAVGSVTGNVGGNVVGSVASVTARVTANTDQLAGQTVTAAAGVTFPTSVASPTNITGGTLTTVGTVTNAVTVGTNNDKTGYSLTQSFPTNFSSLSITAGGSVTAGTVSDKTGYSLTQTFPTHFQDLEIAANGHVTASVASLSNNAITASSIQGGAITAAKFDAGAIDAAALASDAATEIATAVLTTSMTESYRAAGVAPTLAQAAFELVAHMGDSAISGTTKTLKKIDGTTAKTFTLDSATVPTSITETT